MKGEISMRLKRMTGQRAAMPEQSSWDLQEDGVSEMFSRLVEKKREEAYVKMRTGEWEPSFPIGAVSYTETEWDNLLKGFDRIEEMLRAQMEMEHARAIEKAEKRRQYYELSREEKRELLAAEKMECTQTDPSTLEPVRYLVFFTKRGIYCRREGYPGIQWVIKFVDDTEYDRVMTFITEFGGGNLLRTAENELFWKELLEKEE